MTTLISAILVLAFLTGLWFYSMHLHYKRMDKELSRFFDRCKEKSRLND